ncbi:alpha/beta hydrolase family protein [Curtobacterium sp. VKM Ac-1376]|uniref:alpha/beta hydrolase family protein n=1 Tax=Curtobacterium sp. VKM Ac-1376 TaxID=123312 RepID=UPI00188C59D6|nr:alpha/beta fold hydrolase [Curtobacterium sp. VKM Ac-1376]MBF4616430.1 alpha/beta fold hydrolase [Curtobacterium sp. VKM Ac-1376]
MMQAHGGAARSKLVDLLAIPEPSAIHPTAVRRQHLRLDDSTRWDHIELDTPDGDTIPCILITPHKRSDVDVIAVHQHAGAFTLGKSEPAGLAGDPNLAYGLALAHAGARVVLPDLVGFEERQRHWSDDPGADERLDALFRVTDGSSLQAKHTRDIAVVTSWMGESDSPATQLSIVGHSLGGQVALFSLALDPRISRGVVSCGLGTLASFEAARIRHNPAWFVPRLRSAGDVALVAAAVERPVFVAAGRVDRLFPMDGVREVLAAFRPELLTAQVFDGGHSLPPQVLDAAVQHLVTTSPTPSQ